MERERKKVNFTVKCLTNTMLSQVIKLTSTVNFDVNCHFTSVVFQPKTHNPNLITVIKNQTNPHLWIFYKVT